MKKIFFVLNKYQSVTHVSMCIFQGLFKNIVFRCVALVTKKLWAISDFTVIASVKNESARTKINYSPACLGLIICPRILFMKTIIFRLHCIKPASSKDV